MKPLPRWASIPCMSLCQATLSSWAAAQSSTSVSASFVWQSERFVAKSRLLAGKTADHSQCATLSSGWVDVVSAILFYARGHARIPAQYDYISWMLHMSFYVLCGGIVGLVLKEWNNAGRRPVTVLSLGCVVIIVAANIVGIGMAN